MTATGGARGSHDGERLAEVLHGGLVQHVTALALAVDNALLHHAAGDADAVGDALRTARALADATADGCRALIDDLRADGGP